MTIIRRRTLAGLAAALLLSWSGTPLLAQTVGGALVAGTYAGANSLDPHFISSTTARTFLSGIFESLVTVDENGSPIPMLAESYDVSVDGLTYTFKLRTDVTFHNGQALTATDVKASLERFGRISPEKIIMATVTGIDTPDDHTVVLTLSESNPLFIDKLASPASPSSIIPASEAEKELNEAGFIGTGPYQVAEWVPDNRFVMSKFTGYAPRTDAEGRDGLGGKKTAYLDKVTFLIMPETSSRIAALESGQVQFVDDVPPATAERLKSGGQINVVPLETFQMPALVFNFAKAPTSDIRVRQAILAALDLNEALPVVADNGPSTLDASFLYAGNALYSEAGSEYFNQANVAKAKALLAEAGYKGEQIVLNVGSLGIMTRMGLVVNEQLTNAGFNVLVQNMDVPTLLSSFTTDEGWNLATGGFGVQPFLGAYSWQRMINGPTNLSRSHNDTEMDALWAEFNAATDVPARAEIFSRIQGHTYEQAYFAKMGNVGQNYALSPKLEGFTSWPGPVRFWDVWLEP